MLETVIAAVALMIFGPIAYGAFIAAPYLPLLPAATRLMLRATKIAPGEVACDMGAGTGRTLVLAKKEFGIDLQGIEIAPVLWLAGACNLLAHGMSARRLRLGNFYRMDIGSIDVFFCFLMPKAMARLREKLEREAKPGARLVSYAFTVDGWTPARVAREPGLSPVFVYVVATKARPTSDRLTVDS